MAQGPWPSSLGKCTIALTLRCSCFFLLEMIGGTDWHGPFSVKLGFCQTSGGKYARRSGVWILLRSISRIRCLWMLLIIFMGLEEAWVRSNNESNGVDEGKIDTGVGIIVLVSLRSSIALIPNAGIQNECGKRL